ncbi:MAG: RNA polymerase sigma factor [Ruminiclostridium sp.]
MDANEIYEQYSKKIMGYIRSRITSQSIAEDLHSEVFLKICSKLKDFDETKASVSTWVFTITRNTIIDYFRTSRPTCEMDENVRFMCESQGETAEVFSGIESREQLEELAKALKKLNERERDIVVFHYYSGIPLKQVAEKMGLAYSTVRLAHNSALAKLKKYLDY